jgi:hypothetical protein
MTNTLRDMPILFIGARVVGKHCLTAALASGANIAGLLHLDDKKSGVTVAHTHFDDVIAQYGLNVPSHRSRARKESSTSIGRRHLPRVSASSAASPN